jgi:hypothetical protein
MDLPMKKLAAISIISTLLIVAVPHYPLISKTANNLFVPTSISLKIPQETKERILSNKSTIKRLAEENRQIVETIISNNNVKMKEEFDYYLNTNTWKLETIKIK